jgi:RimJ/RimL family protein N-acetyltransferase
MGDMNLIGKMKKELDERGVRGLGQKIWKKLSGSLFYTTSSIWYERDLTEPIHHFSPDIDVETRFLVHDKSVLIEWLKENASRFPWIYFEKELPPAIEYNHVFMVMLREGSIIGYVKIGRNRCYIHDFDKTISFKERTAFIYDTFVIPEYRGKALALFALNQSSQYLKDQGLEKIVCHIEKWNISSIRTFIKGGFRIKDSIRFIKLCHLPFFVRSGFQPFFDLGKQVAQMPSTDAVS